MSPFRPLGGDAGNVHEGARFAVTATLRRVEERAYTRWWASRRSSGRFPSPRRWADITRSHGRRHRPASTTAKAWHRAGPHRRIATAVMRRRLSTERGRRHSPRPASVRLRQSWRRNPLRPRSAWSHHSVLHSISRLALLGLLRMDQEIVSLRG